MTLQLCAIGNALVDIIANTDEAFLATHTITKGGMQLVDEARAEALYASVGPAIEMSGGSASNTVAGFANLGGRAAFIGKAKSDQLGKIFAHDLQAQGVHFTTPMLSGGPATGRCLVLVTADAERSMQTYLGAAVTLTSADLDQALLRRSAITYLEGYLLSTPGSAAALAQAAQLARQAGNRVALTLSDSWLVDAERDTIKNLIKDGIDILFANEHELLKLYPAENVEAALQQARQQIPLVACTQSAAGAQIATISEIIRVPAAPVTKVVDTTGAGDLFAAGFLFGLAEKMPLAAAAALGCRCAGQIIQHYGPRPQTTLKVHLAA